MTFLIYIRSVQQQLQLSHAYDYINCTVKNTTVAVSVMKKP